MMTSALQLLLDGLVIVEFAVNDNVLACVFAGDRLVTGGEVDDAEASMP
jgi:hypothetical protein